MNGPALVWSAVSLGGLILSLWLLVEHHLDIRSMAGLPGNGRIVHARANRLKEIIRASIHGLFLLIGLLTLDRPSSGFNLITLILIYGNAGIMVNSFIELRTRSRLYRHRATDRPETVIEKEDREVGDHRRDLQEKHGTAPGRETEG